MGKRWLMVLCCLVFHSIADAEESISPGAPGVFMDAETQTIKLSIFAGACRLIPYSMVIDGVKAMSGTLNLTSDKIIKLGNSRLKLSCSARHGIDGEYLR